jgi:hypothetical protein
MDRTLCRRIAAIALSLAPLAIAPGCAQTREVAQIMTAPVGATDDAERAYDNGHRLGSRDAKREQPADYTRYAERYTPATERSFATGFRDGYAGRPNRMGKATTRDWVEGR